MSKLWPSVHNYAQIVAFPLIAGLLGSSVIAITTTHPKNIVRLAQAKAHTDVVISRAEAASKIAVLEARSIVERAELDHLREKNKHEEEYIRELANHVEAMKGKITLINSISEPVLRERLARELGFDPDTIIASPPPVLPQLEKKKWRGGALVNGKNHEGTMRPN